MMAEGCVNEAGEVRWAGNSPPPFGLEVRGHEDRGRTRMLTPCLPVSAVFALPARSSERFISSVETVLREKWSFPQLFLKRFVSWRAAVGFFGALFDPLQKEQCDTMSVVLGDWHPHTHNHFFLSCFIQPLQRKCHSVLELRLFLQWFWHRVIVQFTHLSPTTSQILRLNRSRVHGGSEWATCFCPVFVTNDCTVKQKLLEFAC